MSAVLYPHIELDANGAALVSGTTTKVVQVVLDHLAHHWHAEDIQKQYPYLTMGQIHSALAYYYDHQEEMDQEIERRRRIAGDIEARRSDRAIPDKLRQLGHLP